MVKSSCNELFMWLTFLLLEEMIFRMLFVSKVPVTGFLGVSFKSVVFTSDKTFL